MKILIACEYSGVVRDAFIRKGHDAVSCDLLPSESSLGNHYQGDVMDIINDGWDMMIAHPPCTYLSVSGMHWTTRGLRDPQLTEEALDFVQKLMDAPINKIAIENPVSVISSRIRKPDQIIQPWQFGHNASKKTCLWLKNLPKLRTTTIYPPQGWSVVKTGLDMVECYDCGDLFCEEHGQHFADCPCIGISEEDDVIMKLKDGVMFGSRDPCPPKMLWDNQTPSGQNKLGKSDDRWKLRSATYEGIAEAMAEQWGGRCYG